MIIPLWRSRNTSGRLCALSLRRPGPRKSKLCDTSSSVHVLNRRSRNTSGRLCNLSLRRPRPSKSKLRNEASRPQRAACVTWLDARNCVGETLCPESAPAAKRHTRLLAHVSRTSARMPNLRHPPGGLRRPTRCSKAERAQNTAPRRSMAHATLELYIRGANTRGCPPARFKLAFDSLLDGLK